MVEGVCQEDFVDVERESGEGESLGEGDGEALEEGKGGDGEWVVHGCCAVSLCSFVCARRSIPASGEMRALLFLWRERRVAGRAVEFRGGEYMWYRTLAQPPARKEEKTTELRGGWRLLVTIDRLTHNPWCGTYLSLFRGKARASALTTELET